MNKVLSKLVDNLVTEGDQHLHHIKHHFPDPNHRKLLHRKGVYPYEWMNSMEKMEHTSLPPKECFNSTLTMSDISDKDYTHAQNVWETFNMKTMGDYHDLYLLTYVLLLANCFENFRKNLLTLLWTGSSSLLYCSRIVLGCCTQDDQSETRTSD